MQTNLTFPMKYCLLCLYERSTLYLSAFIRMFLETILTEHTHIKDV